MSKAKKERPASDLSEDQHRTAVTTEGVPGHGSVTTSSNIDAEVQLVVQPAAPPPTPRPRRQLTADEAIQQVYARTDLPAYWHAGHTEYAAIEALVASGWDRAKATGEVRLRLYS